MLERILGLYVEGYQDTVWDFWDCPDYMEGEYYLDAESLDGEDRSGSAALSIPGLNNLRPGLQMRAGCVKKNY